MQQRMKQGTEKMENDLIGSSWVHVSSLEPISCVWAVGHVVQMFYGVPSLWGKSDIY